MQKSRGKIMGRIFVALMAIWLGLQGTVRAASNVLTVSGVVKDKC